MPQKMRRAALASSLSLQVKNGAIFGLESYPEAIKTKDARKMLEKMPVELGRKIIIVTADNNASVNLSVRNIPNVRTVMAQYLNPLDVLGSRQIVFMVDAIKKLEQIHGKEEKTAKTAETTKTAKTTTKESTTTSTTT